jgi:hypothetical protein
MHRAGRPFRGPRDMCEATFCPHSRRHVRTDPRAAGVDRRPLGYGVNFQLPLRLICAADACAGQEGVSATALQIRMAALDVPVWTIPALGMFRGQPTAALVLSDPSSARQPSADVQQQRAPHATPTRAAGDGGREDDRPQLVVALDAEVVAAGDVSRPGPAVTCRRQPRTAARATWAYIGKHAGIVSKTVPPA